MVDIDHEQIAEVIDQLIQHEGWAYVENYILTRINDCEGRLILSCLPEEVQTIRAVREAFKSILQHVNELKNPTE